MNYFKLLIAIFLFNLILSKDVVVDYLAGLAQQNEQLFSVVTSLAAQNKLNGKENYQIPRTPFDDDEIFLAHEKKLLEKDYRNFYVSVLILFKTTCPDVFLFISGSLF